MYKRPRILCLTSNFPRWEGDSTTPFVLHLAQDLQRIGFQVDVLAPHAPGCASREDIGGIHVERFRYFWPEGMQSVCYQGGALINLRKNKLNYAKLPAFVLAEWAAVRRRIATGFYDLLHSHWVLPQGFVGALATLEGRIPHVITVHGGDVFGLKGRFFARLKQFAFNRADAVTVNSSATRKAVEAVAPGIRTIQCIPMGVAVSSAPEQAARKIEIKKAYRRGRGPLLVFVGRIVEEKGVEDFVRAISILKETCPDITGLVVGEGQDAARMKRLAEDLGLSGRIVFTGWVDSTEVPLYLSAGDVFVAPSRIAEGQGLTILEAMASKIPVVATRTGGILDFVKDCRTGLLVERNSPEEIAMAVRRISENPIFSTELVKQAKKMVLENFSRETSAASFASLFVKIKNKIQKYNL